MLNDGLTTEERLSFFEVRQTATAILCFSHLRWNFVFQRPQHLMSLFCKDRPVIYFEEPIFDAASPYLSEYICDSSGVRVITPHLPPDKGYVADLVALRRLVTDIVRQHKVSVLWYYTPMSLAYSRELPADLIIYDCMDELANFHFAPPELLPLEAELIGRADLIFTGGKSLYRAKRQLHPAVSCFPSRVDAAHFGRARALPRNAAADQAGFGAVRLGYFGVIDERMDLALLEHLAQARPAWTIIMVGPVVKIDPVNLPVRANLQFLGARSYDQLPDYLAGWDVALIPFAINDATRFISPTKTPEYLAGGCPVVSTPINDVIHDYGHLAGVAIAPTGDAFLSACERMLALARDEWLPEVDAMLGEMSWEETYRSMTAIMAAQTANSGKMLAAVSR